MLILAAATDQTLEQFLLLLGNELVSQLVSIWLPREQ
jgi:hypothetical protein